MSWVIGGITLPLAPKVVRYTAAANIREVGMPGSGGCLLISFGKRADKLEIEGILAYPGYTKGQLETSYLLPLKNLVYTQVTVSAPDTRYYSTNWIVESFEWEEAEGPGPKFKYKITLLKSGQTPVVIS